LNAAELLNFLLERARRNWAGTTGDSAGQAAVIGRALFDN
jgi:hypothetical protein